jgi:hypothetical protein
MLCPNAFFASSLKFRSPFAAFNCPMQTQTRGVRFWHTSGADDTELGAWLRPRMAITEFHSGILRFACKSWPPSRIGITVAKEQVILRANVPRWLANSEKRALARSSNPSAD